jgi:hypothetical protein
LPPHLAHQQRIDQQLKSKSEAVGSASLLERLQQVLKLKGGNALQAHASAVAAAQGP